MKNYKDLLTKEYSISSEEAEIIIDNIDNVSELLFKKYVEKMKELL